MKMKKVCILLLFCIIGLELNSQNRLPFKVHLPVYSITDNTFKNAIDSFFANPSGVHIAVEKKPEKIDKINSINKVNKTKHVFHIYISLDTENFIYRLNFVFAKRSLTYSGIYMYQHAYIQQFFILYKNYYILTFFENDKYPRYETNDMSVIEFPFLHLMDTKKSVLMKKAPEGYYDNNYQGEKILNTSTIFDFYEYKNGKFGKYEWIIDY